MNHAFNNKVTTLNHSTAFTIPSLGYQGIATRISKDFVHSVTLSPGKKPHTRKIAQETLQRDLISGQWEVVKSFYSYLKEGE